MDKIFEILKKISLPGKKLLFLSNKNGFILPMTLMFLFVLTAMGIFATTTTNIELQIAGNDKISKMIFYAADSGIDYVAVNPDLYGSKNLDEAVSVSFPDIADADAAYSISDKLQVNGIVTYVGMTQMPEGSGYSAEIIFAVNYEIESRSTGPNNGSGIVKAGFYRIGL
jgi:hypothetical protein